MVRVYSNAGHLTKGKVAVVRVKAKPKTAKKTADRALRIARGVANSRETKFYGTRAKHQFTPVVPVGTNGLLLSPLRGLGIGNTNITRIGDRIKVKKIQIEVKITSLGGNNQSNYTISGGHYQFVVAQQQKPVVEDGNLTTSFAGRYWDINSAGQPLTPASGSSDPEVWAFKATDSRRYNTKTIVRKCGTIKPIALGTIGATGDISNVSGVPHTIFKGVIRPPKKFITYTSNNVPLEEVYVFLVLDVDGSNTADQVEAISLVTFTDA